MMKRKMISAVLAAVMTVGMITGCGSSQATTENKADKADKLESQTSLSSTDYDFEKEYAGKICDDEIVLDTDKWIEFHLYDIFEIHVGNKFDRSKMSMGAPTVNFVGRSSENNGVTAFVDEIEGTEPYKEGNLTVALGGEYLGSCFIQDYPFYTSQNVNVLIPKEDIDIFTKMFIAHLVRYESANNYKAFARELNAHIKTDFVIKLPATVFGKPDYEFMSKYIKSLSFSKKLVQQDNNFCD